MKSNIPSYFVLILTGIMFITGCSGNREDANTKDSASKGDTSFLADKNFVYKNITSTLDLKFVSKRIPPGKESVDDRVYTDSTFKRAYVQLTPGQKRILIAKFLHKDLGVDEDYVAKMMTACFVAKLDKIGDLRPIVISIGGDDYGSLALIILGKNSKPVSGYYLEGGLDGGPASLDDSLVNYEKASYSYLNKNKIVTYRINETAHADGREEKKEVDTDVFVSVIGKSGKITTKQK